MDGGYLHLIFLSPLICFSGWLLREPYFALLTLVVYLSAFDKFPKKQTFILTLGIIILALISIATLVSFLTISFFRFVEGGGSSFSLFDSFGFSQILKNIKIFLTGPFPFYQVFYKVTGYEWHPQTWFFTIFNWTMYYIIWKKRKFFFDKSFRPLSILSASLIGSLIILYDAVHVDYVAVGTIFLIPFVSSFKFNFLNMYFRTLILYISVSAIYFMVAYVITGTPFLGLS